jgi:hypothetical protein
MAAGVGLHAAGRSSQAPQRQNKWWESKQKFVVLEAATPAFLQNATISGSASMTTVLVRPGEETADKASTKSPRTNAPRPTKADAGRMTEMLRALPLVDHSKQHKHRSRCLFR